jgi:hypothetical protein
MRVAPEIACLNVVMVGGFHRFMRQDGICDKADDARLSRFAAGCRRAA